jgi:hypothetical protein
MPAPHVNTSIPAVFSTRLLKLNNFFLRRRSASFNFSFSSTTFIKVLSGTLLSSPLFCPPSLVDLMVSINSARCRESTICLSRKHCCDIRFCMRFRSTRGFSSLLGCRPDLFLLLIGVSVFMMEILVIWKYCYGSRTTEQTMRMLMGKKKIIYGDLFLSVTDCGSCAAMLRS